jgi:thioredoxin-related protein
MKTAFIFLIGIWLMSPPGWLTDFDKAKAAAAQQHQYILLNFSGSDWCIPCIRLKKDVFETKEFTTYADSMLVLLNADFPRNAKIGKQQLQHNEMLAERYNPGGKFPYTLLLDAEGKVLGQWDELPATTTAGFIAQIKQAIQTKK